MRTAPTNPTMAADAGGSDEEGEAAGKSDLRYRTARNGER